VETNRVHIYWTGHSKKPEEESPLVIFASAIGGDEKSIITLTPGGS